MVKSAGHCMLFSKTEQKILGFEMKAIILMQMRFDGKFGFAGGIIEEYDSSPAHGVSREMFEEMGLDVEKFKLTEEHYISCHPADSTEVEGIQELHFYALQIPEESILDIEKNAHKALHFGEEVLGWVRVPLYTMSDGYRGLPAFLNNNFVGNCRDQLLLALEKTGVLTSQEIQAAVIASKFGENASNLKL